MKKILSIIMILIIASIFIGCNKQEESIISDNIEDYKGKPTILLWGATWCPHCVKAIPIFENDIYLSYKDNINILLNTVSKDKFDTLIPQKLNSKLTFTGVTGVDCELIPSWVILDNTGKVLEKSCGSEKDIVDMQATISQMDHKIKNIEK